MMDASLHAPLEFFCRYSYSVPVPVPQTPKTPMVELTGMARTQSSAADM